MTGGVKVSGLLLGETGHLFTEVNTGRETINLQDNLDDNEENQLNVRSEKQSEYTAVYQENIQWRVLTGCFVQTFANTLLLSLRRLDWVPEHCMSIYFSNNFLPLLNTFAHKHQYFLLLALEKDTCCFW